ncbi:MAG: ferredoxin-NADP reductase [Saprospiraceae bacterium]|nr:ferredoxin-NADP reductase [Saprospiraceae bacterium]
MAHLAEYKTEVSYKAKVQSSKRLTPLDSEEIREIILEVHDPNFKCKVDQSFGVIVQHEGPFGNAEHLRFYSVADIPGTNGKFPIITMLVKRCSYVDEFNGERYEGIASNYLCDRKAGDEVVITGPHSLPFVVPDDKSANMILIGMGTGIAPFRAFVKHIYNNVKDRKGKIRLFYGAKSGLELLYLNDKDGDLTNYYDEKTFEAFYALSPRPHWSDPIALDKVIEEKADEIKEMLAYNNCYIYVAGYEKILSKLDTAFSSILGSKRKLECQKS